MRYSWNKYEDSKAGGNNRTYFSLWRRVTWVFILHESKQNWGPKLSWMRGVLTIVCTPNYSSNWFGAHLTHKKTIKGKIEACFSRCFLETQSTQQMWSCKRPKSQMPPMIPHTHLTPFGFDLVCLCSSVPSSPSHHLGKLAFMWISITKREHVWECWPFQFIRKPAPFMLSQWPTQVQIKSWTSNMPVTSTGCYAAQADGTLAQSWLPAHQIKWVFQNN